MKRSFFILFVVLTVWSCKKDQQLLNSNTEPPVIIQTNDIDFKLNNVVGSVPLALSTQTYINLNQDTFTVDLFKYYISNIKLKRDDGFEFAEPNSYHLVDQGDSSSRSFTIKNVPLGNYISMQFIIGVDSAKNCSGAQTGALDPLKDMFWDWSQGYIFAKLQGSCNSVPGGVYIHHVGGFSGMWNAIVSSSPSFGTNLIQVTSNNVPKVYMKADVLEWFQAPLTIDLVNYGAVSTGKKAREIAVNYSDMFSVTSIVN